MGIDSISQPNAPVPGARPDRPARVGRSPQLIVDALTAARSVVIYGSLGFGKSFLLDSVCSLLQARGVVPLLIQGSVRSHSVPFGSLRTGANLSLAQAFADEEPITSARLLSQAGGTTAGGTAHGTTDDTTVRVIVVDDAHLIDAHTMDCVYQLAAGRSVAVLFASDLVSSVVPGTANAETAEFDPRTVRLLDDLWITGRAERLDLEPTSAAASRQLTREFAPDSRFDRVTQALLHARSGGSRALLRELTADVVAQQRLPDTGDRGALALSPPSRRIQDLLTHQLRGLTPAQLVTVALVGALSGTAHARALRLCEPAELADLVRRGYLHRSAAPTALLHAHALLADAARALAEPALLRERTTVLVRALMTDRSHGIATTPAECVLIADLWTASVALPPGVLQEWGASEVADVLLVAARRCRLLGRIDRALLYSGTTARVEPGLKATIEQSRALAASGQHGAAVDVLLGAEDFFRTPADGAKLLRWKVSLSKFCPMTADDFAALRTEAAGWFPGDTEMSGEVEYIDLTQMLQNMDWEGAAAAGERLARMESCGVVTRIRAACIGGIAHAHGGRTACGLELLDLATSLNRGDRARRAADIYSSEGLALEIFYSSAAVRCMTGVDVWVAADELDRWIDSSVTNQDLGNLGILGFVAAQLAQFRGDLAGTEAELRMATAHLDRADPKGWRPWVQSLHASSLARLGLIEAARSTMARARTLSDQTELDILYRFESDRSDLELLMHAGRTDSARAVATRLFDTAGGNGPVTRTWLLDVLVQLGEPAINIVPLLDRAVADSDAPLVHAIAERTRATAARDSAGMDTAAALLAELGAFGSARSASDDAAVLHELAGNAPAAARSRHHAHQHAAASRDGAKRMPPGPPGRARPATGASLPAATIAAAAPPTDSLLTAREREITGLARLGRSNREIATALFLSVRTVESHLYKARVKTGLGPRADAADGTGASAARLGR